jgi:hypothetical protein
LIQLVYDIIGISGKGLISAQISTLPPLPPAARLKRLNSRGSPPAKKRLIEKKTHRKKLQTQNHTLNCVSIAAITSRCLRVQLAISPVVANIAMC